METLKQSLIAIAVGIGLIALLSTGAVESYAPLIFVLLIIVAAAGWDFFEWLHETKGQKRSARAISARLWPALIALLLIPWHWGALLARAIWIGDNHMPPLTADNLVWDAAYILLWLAELFILIRAAVKGEKGKPFTLPLLLLMDGWHIPGMLIALAKHGAAGLMFWLPGR